MNRTPKIMERLLDEEIDEQEFVDIIDDIYKQDCYIYAIIPDWEEDLLNQLSDDFVVIQKIKFPLIQIFPRTIGLLGYVKDRRKQYVYEFYLRSSTIDFFIFSELDISQHLNQISKKNLDLGELFKALKVPHITVGPDGQWLRIVEY